MKRKAKISRKTKETSIAVEVNIDGTGKYKMDTGIGFLDHMLEQLSKHSLMDITVKAKGDTHIDLHHTTEDTGIAIGEALKKAAGNLKGINTELFKEWFQAFSQSAGVTLHVENIYGDNSHHKIESCFKGLARSLKDAFEIDQRIKSSIPSTKGRL